MQKNGFMRRKVLAIIIAAILIILLAVIAKKLINNDTAPHTEDVIESAEETESDRETETDETDSFRYKKTRTYITSLRR